MRSKRPVARPFGADPEPGEADENKEKWVVWKRLRGGSGATAAAEIYDLACRPTTDTSWWHAWTTRYGCSTSGPGRWCAARRTTAITCRAWRGTR